VRAQAQYTDKNTLDRALRFTGSVKLDRLSQEALAGLYLPRNAKGHVYGVEGKYSFQDIQGVQRTDWSLTGARTFTVEERESQQSLQFLTESRTLADGSKDDRKALLAAQTWRWNNLDDLLAPRRGYFLSVQAGAAAEALLSDSNFGRLYGKGTYLLPVRDFGTVVLRAEAGAVLAESRDSIPSAYLFRTGGDTTVRGYAFESLGVAEGGAVVGGRYLGVGSIEYIQWIRPQWGAAVFVDAGNAVDEIEDFRAALGYGVGARWSSPIGSLNLDVAYGEQVGEWRLHFSAGIVLR
jgi:translocation and assembly module TamA